MNPYTAPAESSNRFNNVRASIAGRVSKLFGASHYQDNAGNHSLRTSAACEVPIFMSPSSDHLEHPDLETQSPAFHRGSAGVNTQTPIDEQGRRLTIPASSVYSESPGQQNQARFMEETGEGFPSHDLEQGTSYQTSTTLETYPTRTKYRRRRRVRESTRQKIASKQRLSVAFGITAVAAAITYVALAATGTARGLMFHVLSVLFTLILLGIFLHSLIRLIMLRKRRAARKARHQNWHGSQSRSVTPSSSRSGSSSSDPFADPVLEKPVEIMAGPEEVVTTTPRGKNKKVVRQPPPVYGNFRDSKRMNPEMIFWQRRTPSPTTPTYEQAMHDVQNAVGFQPPQYISPKRERQAQGEVCGTNIHPLERERLVGLMGNTMSSQRRW